jgi:hypothetical protein
MKRIYYVLGWGYVAACMFLTLRARPLPRVTVADPQATHDPAPAPTVAGAADGAEWFRRVKPYCNAVEVHVLQRQMTPPATSDGAGYHAACFALAGRIDDARKIIDKLPDSQRAAAAGIVFNVGHPVADAGDDRSAGPIMELVIDYWPNHYMALYHAGMAEYMLGQRELATRNLEAFLKLYQQQDGWNSNARDVLARLRDTSVEKSDARRPREP